MSKRVLREATSLSDKEVQLPNIYIEKNTGKHAAVVCPPNLPLFFSGWLSLRAG
jgi:hypothetical protein